MAYVHNMRILKMSVSDLSNADAKRQFVSERKLRVEKKRLRKKGKGSGKEVASLSMKS